MKRVLSPICALLLSGLVVWLTLDLAFARICVAVILAACFVVQLRYPEAWLLYLPALLPVADLALWSGRLYIDEFDILVLATASAHFWRATWIGRQPFPNLNAKGGVLIGVVFASFMLSMVIGALPLSHPDATQLSNYLSHYNALRVAKSAVWGMLLVAPLQSSLARNPSRAETLFVVGTSIGLVLVGLIVLWERGVFLTIAQSHGLYAGRWAILGAVLDFTSSYRATALFSELHTGGEAMDGYLALAAPIAAAGALVLRPLVARTLCVAGTVLGTYAIMAGYSRSLYAAYGGALVLLLVLSLIRGERTVLRGRFALWRVLAAVILAEAALFVAYDHGGWTALAVAVGFAATALAVMILIAGTLRGSAAMILAAIFAGGSYLMFRAFIASRYNVIDAGEAMSWAAICGVALVVSALLIGARTVPIDRRAAAAAIFGVFATINLIVIPASSGTRMFDRFLATSTDADTRWDHWREAARLIGPTWTDYVFGMGLGSFPRIYFQRGISPESKPTFRYLSEGGRSWVELGVGDYNLTQKIRLRPDTDYQLQLSARVKDPGARFYAKLCPKLILYSDRYTPGCPVFGMRSPVRDQWTTYRFRFNSGALGREGILGWPITLMLNNESDTAAVDLTDISLRGPGGDNLVANGDFAKGNDRWIFISDFEHLGWHIKNLYLELLFESGAVGLAIFLFASALALATAIRSARHMAIGMALAGGLAGFLLVGSFGSLFDNPRPATLFFIVLFWGLQRSTPPRMARHTDQSRSPRAIDAAASERGPALVRSVK